MKKKSIMKILAATICVSMMMSVTAFAADAPQGGESVPAAKIEQAQYASDYKAEQGTVNSVTEKDGTYTFSLGTENSEIIFHTTEKSFVMDQKSGAVISVKDIKEGMKLAVVMPVNTPMTLSLPAQISGAVAFIVMSEGASVEVSRFNDSLTNADNTLKLNISEDTKIMDTNGTKQDFTADDVKSRDCIVLYSVTTRSIPAQTNPAAVILLDQIDKSNGSVNEEDIKNENAGIELHSEADSYVELRTAAEAKGYKIEWTSNKKPIVLTKGDMKLELTIGDTAFSFTHMTKDLKELDRMTKLAMPVTLENGKTMVAKSLIDAME